MTGPQTRQRPAGTGREVASKKPHAHSTANPVSLLLSRLDNVRQYGSGYRADCPTGHRSRGTLAIGVGDDDRVLLHCHAGCHAADVLGSLGLTLADLHPDRPRDLSPMGRRKAREAVRAAHWAAALGVLATEATVIEVAATMIERGERLSGDDTARVRVAASRIHGCREVLA